MRKKHVVLLSVAALLFAGLFALHELGVLSMMWTMLASPAPSLPANFSSAAIPFELVGGHVMFDIKVNDSSHSVILDTGDRYAIIDLDVAKALGLKLGLGISGGGTGGGKMAGAIVRDTTFTIPGFDGYSQPLTLAFPLKQFSTRLGHDCDGILGTDMIKHFVVEIDYENRRVTFHNPKTFTYSGRGESIPIYLDKEKHPTIEATVTPVGGVPIKGNFSIDVGAKTGLSLYSQLVTQHHLPGTNVASIPEHGVSGAGGDSTGVMSRVAELQLGQFKFNRPTTYFSQDTAGAFADPDIQGNIGEGLLGQFKLFLDYGNNRIIFEPSGKFAGTYDPAFTGAKVVATGVKYKTFEVADVDANSAASEAGVLKGDVIAAVDGHLASELTLTNLQDLFNQPVARAVTLHRGGQTLQVTLKPRTLP